MDGGRQSLSGVLNLLYVNLNQTELHKWKLQGFPFIATGAGGIASRLLQVQLLNLLATFGWEFHASVDFSSAGSDATASDSWYMRKYV